MERDTKTIIIWILAIALVIVSVFFIREVQKPDRLAQIQTTCSDMSTLEKRNACIQALNEVQTLIQAINTR